MKTKSYSTKKMQEVWGAIKDGADAYLGKQLRSIIPLILVLTIALFASVFIVPPTPEASVWYCGVVKGVPVKAMEECGESLPFSEQQQIRIIFWIWPCLCICPWSDLFFDGRPDRYADGCTG